jgi:hypothetical protein
LRRRANTAAAPAPNRISIGGAGTSWPPVLVVDPVLPVEPVLPVLDEVLDEVDELVLLEVDEDVDPVDPPEVAPLDVEVEPPELLLEDDEPPEEEELLPELPWLELPWLELPWLELPPWQSLPGLQYGGFPPVLPPEEDDELDEEEELDEDDEEELDPPLLVEVEPPDVEVEPPDVEVEPPEVVVETTMLPPLEPPPPPKKPPKKPPPNPPSPPPPITIGIPPPSATIGCGGGGGMYCGTATIAISGCSQHSVFLMTRRIFLVSFGVSAFLTTRLTGFFTSLTLRYWVSAAGFSAMWTAPPPTTAAPAATADNFARAIRTDISMLSFAFLSWRACRSVKPVCPCIEKRREIIGGQRR